MLMTSCWRPDLTIYDMTSKTARGSRGVWIANHLAKAKQDTRNYLVGYRSLMTQCCSRDRSFVSHPPTFDPSQQLALHSHQRLILQLVHSSF